MVEHQPSKCEDLSSNSGITKNRQTNKQMNKQSPVPTLHSSPGQEGWPMDGQSPCSLVLQTWQGRVCHMECVTSVQSGLGAFFCEQVGP
jgi:hypothetical protein